MPYHNHNLIFFAAEALRYSALTGDDAEIVGKRGMQAGKIRCSYESVSPHIFLLLAIFFCTVSQVVVARKESDHRETMRVYIS